MPFNGKYVNIIELAKHIRDKGPFTLDDVKKLGDQPSTRIVVVDGEPLGDAKVSITKNAMTVK